MFVILLKNLSNRVGIILVLALFLSRLKPFRKLVSKENIDNIDRLILAFIFGIFGIIGTYTGIKTQGAIVNSRVIGVFVGGLLGGPVVGFLAGLIAGSHRFLIDIGGFTAFSCGIATIIEGIVAGFLKERFEKSEHRVMFAFLWGTLAELIQMALILFFVKPFQQSYELVSVIWVPMVFANSVGIAAFIAITDSIFREIENEAVYQAQLALKIADRTLMYFRKGYNEETAMDTANIIWNMTNIDAVAFTDREKVLAHVGAAEDHHLPGNKIQTNLTKEALYTKSYIIANTQEEIGCNTEGCQLKSAVIVPIRDENNIIGMLKLYKTKENSITKVERELALGLAQIFSTQIELSKIDYQKELLSKSELKALQAQINPHFLFNAINTIVSLVRTQPDDARRLLVHLGTFFRKNLQQEIGEVDLSKEIDHINSYVEIEKARFGDKLNIVYDIDRDIKCSLPPLLLQPLVENAIKHGVLKRIEGGTVKISGEQNESITKIRVEDDGVGIPEKILKNIFKERENADGIGLRNVNERLKNKYGNEYGLIIESEYGSGTNVTMILPRIQGEI